MAQVAYACPWCGKGKFFFTRADPARQSLRPGTEWLTIHGFATCTNAQCGLTKSEDEVLAKMRAAP